MSHGKMYKTNIWYWDAELQCNVTIIGDLTVLSDASRTELERHTFKMKIIPRDIPSGVDFLTVYSTKGEYLSRIIMGLEVGDPRVVLRRDLSGDERNVYDVRYKNLVIYENGVPEGEKAHRPRQGC